jgi:hypothetical protein
MNPIYQEVASKLNKDPEVVECIMEHCFSWLRLQLTEPASSKILFNGLGTFQMLFPKMKRALVSKSLPLRDKERTRTLLHQFNQLNKEENE